MIISEPSALTVKMCIFRLKRFFDKQRYDSAGKNLVRMQKCLILLFGIFIFEFSLRLFSVYAGRIDLISLLLVLVTSMIYATILYMGWAGSVRRHTPHLMAYNLWQFAVIAYRIGSIMLLVFFGMALTISMHGGVREGNHVDPMGPIDETDTAHPNLSFSLGGYNVGLHRVADTDSTTVEAEEPQEEISSQSNEVVIGGAQVFGIAAVTYSIISVVYYAIPFLITILSIAFSAKARRYILADRKLGKASCSAEEGNVKPDEAPLVAHEAQPPVFHANPYSGQPIMAMMYPATADTTVITPPAKGK